MAMETGNFGQLLEPVLNEIWGLNPASYKEEYSKIFTVKNSKKQTEHTLNMSGFGTMPSKAQGSGVTYAEPLQGFKHSVSHTTFALGFIVTKEMYMFEQYQIINMLPKALRLSGIDRVETDAANILNRAFNSSYTGGDGKELCATDHPAVSGGTFRNELFTAADLSMTSLEQALIDIQAMTTEAGLKGKYKPVRLICPKELEWTVSQLLKSEKDPGNANNAINPAKGLLPSLKMQWLTDPDAWYIQTDAPNNLVFYWARRPDFTRDNDFDTENAKFKEVQTYVCTWDDPRAIFGSPGAAEG